MHYKETFVILLLSVYYVNKDEGIDALHISFSIFHILNVAPFINKVADTPCNKYRSSCLVFVRGITFFFSIISSNNFTYIYTTIQSIIIEAIVRNQTIFKKKTSPRPIKIKTRFSYRVGNSRQSSASLLHPFVTLIKHNSHMHTHMRENTFDVYIEVYIVYKWHNNVTRKLNFIS